eukprot:Skav201529  [mRNA]  locus=scaffold3018:60630:63781:+ [translate_table: standard]
MAQPRSHRVSPLREEAPPRQWHRGHELELYADNVGDPNVVMPGNRFFGEGKYAEACEDIESAVADARLALAKAARCSGPEMLAKAVWSVAVETDQTGTVTEQSTGEPCKP